VLTSDRYNVKITNKVGLAVARQQYRVTDYCSHFTMFAKQPIYLEHCLRHMLCI